MVNYSTNTVQVHIAAFDEVSNNFKFLALKRADNIAIYPGIWQTITGTIEDNETALKTAVREVFEETGLYAEANKMFTLPYIASFFNTETNSICFVPVFGIISNTFAIKISQEHSEYKWLNAEECIDLFPLPAHREGLKIFQTNVLASKNSTLYQIKL